MGSAGVDADLLHAWVAGRSLARGLPIPVADRGGYRVDTGSEVEAARWVFPRIDAGLIELAHALRRPRLFLKARAEPDEMRAALPARWTLHPTAWFMMAGEAWRPRSIPAGYDVETLRASGVAEVRIRGPAGERAATGFAAETQGAFVYDRITVAPEHRRRGLGAALMTTLRQARREPGGPELLTATAEGRALYAALGWWTLSPYVTASLPTP